MSQLEKTPLDDQGQPMAYHARGNFYYTHDQKLFFDPETQTYYRRGRRGDVEKTRYYKAVLDYPYLLDYEGEEGGWAEEEEEADYEEDTYPLAGLDDWLVGSLPEEVVDPIIQAGLDDADDFF